MFEPYMDDQRLPNYHLEKLYGEALAYFGKNIIECVEHNHFGDDTYFDYFPCANDFIRAFWDVLQFEQTKFYLSSDLLIMATEGIHSDLLGQMVTALDKLEKLVLIIDPEYDLDDPREHTDWFREIAPNAMKAENLLRWSNCEDYMEVRTPEEFAEWHKGYQTTGKYRP